MSQNLYLGSSLAPAAGGDDAPEFVAGRRPDLRHHAVHGLPGAGGEDRRHDRRRAARGHRVAGGVEVGRHADPRRADASELRFLGDPAGRSSPPAVSTTRSPRCRTTRTSDRRRSCSHSTVRVQRAADDRPDFVRLRRRAVRPRRHPRQRRDAEPRLVERAVRAVCGAGDGGRADRQPGDAHRRALVRPRLGRHRRDVRAPLLPLRRHAPRGRGLPGRPAGPGRRAACRPDASRPGVDRRRRLQLGCRRFHDGHLCPAHEPVAAGRRAILGPELHVLPGRPAHQPGLTADPAHRPGADPRRRPRDRGARGHRRRSPDAAPPFWASDHAGVVATVEV